MKVKKLSAFAAVIIALVLLAYTLLVTPRRFTRCLPEVAKYFTRDYDIQRAELPGYVSGNRAQLLVNGDEALPAMLEAINRAQRSIRWQVMLFFPDEVGQELAGALAQAAQRGVKVQLSFNIDQTVNGTLVDNLPKAKQEQQQRAMDQMLAKLRQAGGEVRANPASVDFPLDGAGSEARAIQQSIEQNSCISANHYDHRKLLIIDDQIAFTGGMNVGRNYLYHEAPDPTRDMMVETNLRLANNLPEAWDKWFDSGVQVEGPVVAEMVKEFNWRWEVLGGSPLPVDPAYPVNDGAAAQFLAQRPGSPEVGAAFFDLVNGAQREIWVASPFVSYDPALEALIVASRRGVRVVFVHPNQHNEMRLSNRIYREKVDELIAAGVEVYFNDLRMAHTKLLVVDGRQAMVGSFNLNHRSFRHDLESVLVFEDEALSAQILDRVFIPYLEISVPVTQPLRAPFNLINWVIKPFS